MKNEIRIGLLTVSEAGRILGVGATRVRQLSEAGKLPAFRTPGGTRLIREDDAARLAEERRGRGRTDTPSQDC